MPRKPSFSRYLRDARLKRGLTVAELADSIGVSASQYLLLGNRSGPPTGCQPVGIVQGR